MQFDPALILALREARRINVTGNAGVGKSTLTRTLGRHLDLPVVHLDPLVWEAGWRKRPLADRDMLVADAVAEPTWVIDGVSAAVRLRADAIIFIDLPARTAILRIVRRAAYLGFRSRPELGSGFPEIRAMHHALRIAWRFKSRVRPGIVADLPSTAMVVHLRTPAAVMAFRLSCIRASSVSALPNES